MRVTSCCLKVWVHSIVWQHVWQHKQLACGGGDHVFEGARVLAGFKHHLGTAQHGLQQVAGTTKSGVGKVDSASNTHRPETSTGGNGKRICLVPKQCLPANWCPARKETPPPTTAHTHTHTCAASCCAMSRGRPARTPAEEGRRPNLVTDTGMGCLPRGLLRTSAGKRDHAKWGSSLRWEPAMWESWQQPHPNRYAGPPTAHLRLPGPQS